MYGKDKVNLGFLGPVSAYQAFFQISLPRWDHARGFLGLGTHCATFLSELLVHIILTYATPSVFRCLGARGGYALNNVKFLLNSCAKQTHSFPLPSRGTELGSGSRLLSIQGSRFLVFWPLRGAHFRNSFLREVSQPSKLLCFVLFRSGIRLPRCGLCAMFLL